MKGWSHSGGVVQTPNQGRRDPLRWPSNPNQRLCLTSSLLLLPCLHREIKQNWRKFMGHSPSMASGVESFQFETNNLFVSCNKEGFAAGNMGPGMAVAGFLKTTFLVLLPRRCEPLSRCQFIVVTMWLLVSCCRLIFLYRDFIQYYIVISKSTLIIVEACEKSTSTQSSF